MSALPVRAKVEEKVLSAIAEAAGRPQSTVSLDDDVYRDVGLDSLDAVTVFSRLSDDFSVPEPKTNEEFYGLREVGKIVEYVWGHVTGATSQ